MAGGLQRRGSVRNRYRPMSEINVTPMVDVMLVLLIVFMVAAPLLTAGVPLELPKTPAKSINDNHETVTVAVKQNGDIFIQETQVDLDTLTDKLSALTNANQDAAVFVRGDQAVEYHYMAEVLTRIANAGYTKVNLITNQVMPPARTP